LAKSQVNVIIGFKIFKRFESFLLENMKGNFGQEKRRKAQVLNTEMLKKLLQQK
jgi:hypothetical protein